MNNKPFVLLLLLLVLPLQLLASDLPSQRLADYLRSINSLEAVIDQQIRDARGERLQQVSGSFKLLKPGRFYWETRHPYAEVLISNGETLWLYDPELEQVTIQPVDARLAQTPAQLLAGGDVDELLQGFDVYYAGGLQHETFTLTPLSQDNLFENLRLYFAEGKLQALEIQDSLGQQTRIELQQLRYNTPLDAADFEFAIPDGVDVLQE